MGVLFGVGVLAGCSPYVKPITTERKLPMLTLNIIDARNTSNSITGAPAAVIPKNPKHLPVDNGVNLDTSSSENYVYLFEVVAQDAGGIADFGFSVQFISFGGCNPNSEYENGSSLQQPVTPVGLNSMGLAPSEQFGLAVESAANERMIECHGAGPDLAGVYVVTGTATNTASRTANATWYVNIGAQHTIPVQPGD